MPHEYRVNNTANKAAIERAYSAGIEPVLRRLYVELQMSVYDIQVEFARRGIVVSTTTISRWLPQYGIQPRPVGNPMLQRRGT